MIEAFNHLRSRLLSRGPAGEGGQRVLLDSGDDGGAKQQVAALVERPGFFGIVLATLAVASRFVQFPGGPLAAHDLVGFG